MKQLLKEIKEWEQGYTQYVVYSYKLTLWLYLNRWRRLVSFIKKYSGIIRRIALVIVGGGSGLIANYFGVLALAQGDLSTYLITIGAMTGGTIAIIYSISIFLLQGVTDLYSSKHLEEYTNNWRDQIIYIVVIIITLGLFGTGLLVAGLPNVTENISSQIVLWSLALVGLVFALIDWQYEIIRKKITPRNALDFLQKKGGRFLKKLQYDADKLAKIICARDPSISNEKALAVAYNNVLQPFINDLDRQLETLVEVSLKLSDRQEIETTKQGLKAVHDLLAKFLEARKTSSLVIPSRIAFLALESDSQKFLGRNFERLNKAGEKFIKEDKDELATYILDIYRSLSHYAKEITFITQRNENPILDHLVGYLNSYIEYGKNSKNLEVVYQGVRVLGDIAVIAAHKGLGSTLHGLQEKILKVGVYGLSQRQNIVFEECTLIFLKIIGATFTSTRLARRQHFDNALKNIATITNYISTLRKSGVLPDDLSSSFSLSKGYDEFYSLLALIIDHYQTLTDERDKRSYRSDIVEFFREVNMSLRTLSENVKSCDTVLTDSIGRLLANINTLIVDMMVSDEFSDIRDKLRERLSWNIHLPGWFVHHAEKFDAGSNPFNTLTDSVAKTGILVAEKLDDKELTQKCIDCLYNMTEDALERTTGKYGYDEPRVLEKACYLGIIALKKGWVRVLVDLFVKIRHNYEPKYFSKYFNDIPEDIDPENHRVIGLPNSRQLEVELWRWRSDYERESRNGMLRIRDDAEAIMYDVIERDDIDRFIYRIWGEEARYVEDISDDIRKEGLLIKLINLLKLRGRDLNRK